MIAGVPDVEGYFHASLPGRSLGACVSLSRRAQDAMSLERICRPALSVFGGEEEEEKPKRKLVKLQYTEEEQRAMEAAQKQVRRWPFSVSFACSDSNRPVQDE